MKIAFQNYNEGKKRLALDVNIGFVGAVGDGDEIINFSTCFPNIQKYQIKSNCKEYHFYSGTFHYFKMMCHNMLEEEHQARVSSRP